MLALKGKPWNRHLNTIAPNVSLSAKSSEPVTQRALRKKPLMFTNRAKPAGASTFCGAQARAVITSPQTIFWLTWPNLYAPNPKPRWIGAFLRLYLTLLGVGFFASHNVMVLTCSAIPVLRAASAAKLTNVRTAGLLRFLLRFLGCYSLTM
jgi:hypothetical protein